jgi:excisionase family DNA binding protein
MIAPGRLLEREPGRAFFTARLHDCHVNHGSPVLAAGRQSQHMKKQLFSTGEAAKLSGLSHSTIIRCFDAGLLRGFRVPGSRFRKVPRHALMEFMRTNGLPMDALRGDDAAPSL